MSRFERAIDGWPVGHTISAVREEKFDRNHGLFFAPIHYEPTPIVVDRTRAPTVEWVRNSFHGMVREEFQDGDAVSISSAPPPMATTEVSDLDLVSLGEVIRDNAEQELIYNEKFAAILAKRDPKDLEGRLRDLLENPTIGNQKNRGYLRDGDLKFLFSRMDVGVRLTFPGLPFRDQNPLRAEGGPELVTLAEVYYLVRLHCTALAIYQVLPTGADILILSDGSFFAEPLGVPEEPVRQYLDGIRRIRNSLNLTGTIQIVELRRIVEIWDAGTGAFEKTVEMIEREIYKFAHPDDENYATFQSLAIGFRRNLNSKDFSASPDDLALWISDPKSDIVGGGFPSRDEIVSRCARYAALNLALKWHDVIGQVLPTAVRATVHPKEGQIGLPSVGSCLPWNGVPIVREGRMEWDKIEVHSLSVAASRNYELAPVSFGETVLYYKRLEG
ncbi:L-tyrosine/L-tryptophan isonitrile synthase family protein [Altererythrobacter luteolus]|uniref:L-tyrosine/L-tryptophan isonitrile synthase family protein n=1 Tax=Pontixanthobacter luteolus TaxID=295089 RepID=A0A6I4V236_9SPHN|nr:L-tyrosine/L-tryptophan isonitrile synthase family protein [Pontixanthobacter luteolus]MXP48227.1 L-tyrosine/L-tryptophan isonitrile synthase family protein [Pontixanthobacter luteolus]